MAKASRAANVHVTTIVATKSHGITKTAVAAGLAWELALTGKNVMLVDADPHCALSKWFVVNFSLRQNPDILSLLVPCINCDMDELRAVLCVMLSSKITEYNNNFLCKWDFK